MLYLTLAVLLSAPHAAKACQSAQSLIEAAEGFRSCVYTDTTGHPTVCYGYNLDDYSAKSDIANVGADYDQVRSGKQCLSKSQCSTLLQGALSAAESGAKNVFGNQCSCIMAVLVDMTYNLGSAGVASFTTFKSYIENGQYSEAASDLKSTLWCSQVGNRCTRDTGIIAGGCNQEESTASNMSAADVVNNMSIESIKNKVREYTRDFFKTLHQLASN
mmetsp:Transcript_16477/g.23098  ORF Transcript_16477/g.23098 Transcript_16477/m.23098 type:complete len:217 (-) Transcript_16477:371-1021(-)|eukprot:CAMPEP_0185255506 /NCGR_PEP_ID=MMETSP1359-20130426/4562_1 /TAXON_ID=552665 /ORGANISM="Bigelowiella longifila, Strain CCMP242" /LENGTH=216 /DNA_ID=CAMNT_0027839473 /DNA_START=28 /DNA_END=678 /DNA_ORIENTATION=+